MSVGIFGLGELVVIAAYCVPVILLLWFVRSVTAMSASMREISDGLKSLESAVREQSRSESLARR